MYNILLLKGDGIGPEIIDAAVLVLKKIALKFDLSLHFSESNFGGDAIDKDGQPLPNQTLELAKAADAILLGSVGGPKWDHQPRNNRPETGLLALRKELGLFANIRPIKDYDFLRDRVAIRPEIVEGVDIIFCRELTGGIYFGQKHREEHFAWDRMEYSREEIERIVIRAFEIASGREKKVLTSVDKANVLETSRLWREVVEDIAPKYPTVQVNHLYVDNAAIQLIVNPRQFDVIVTENSFGDILSDEGGALAGSLGMLPSASLGGKVALYEPAHGSAPDIAGKNIANPIATILSVAMMLRYSFNQHDAAVAIETAINEVLSKNFKTVDIADDKSIVLGTKEFAEAVCEVI